MAAKLWFDSFLNPQPPGPISLLLEDFCGCYKKLRASGILHPKPSFQELDYCVNDRYSPEKAAVMQALKFFRIARSAKKKEPQNE